MSGNPLFDIKTLLPVSLPIAAQGRRLAQRDAATPKGSLGGCPGLPKSPPRPPGTGPPPLAPALAADENSEKGQAAWVRSDEDVVAYYAESQPRALQFFFCNRAPQAHGFAPYDLAVVSQQEASQEEHFIVTCREVVRFSQGELCETTPLSEWVWQKRCFNQLRQKTFFRKYHLAKYFWFWSKTVRQRRLHRMRLSLEASCFMARPTFCAPLLEIGALLARLREVKACAIKADRVYRLGELAEQQAAWRERRARASVEEAVGSIRQVVERVCSGVERRAQEMRDSIKDPSELADRIGVDLYATTTAARARSMWIIKQEKIGKARSFHEAMREVGQLPSFLRLVDAMLAEALAAMAVDSLASALRTLKSGGLLSGKADSAPAAPAVAGAPQAEPGAAAPEGVQEQEGESLALGHGLLFADVVFVADQPASTFSPSQAEWQAALEGALVEGGVQLAAGVAPLASLPAFAKYCQLAADDGERRPALTDGGSIARGSTDFQAYRQGLCSLLERCYSEAAAIARQYDHHRQIFDFHQAFDPELYTQRQRSELDLAEVRRDLTMLTGWRAELENMRSSAVAGCIQVDARSLRATLEPMVTGDLDHIKGMLLQLAADLGRERLEDLHLRLHVVCTRPSELEDFAPWKEQVAEVQKAKELVVTKAALVDDCYDVLLHYGVKIPTSDQVKHDDLRESVSKLLVQLEDCEAYIREQAPAHVDALRASAKGLRDDAILLEETLKSGMYVDAGCCAREVVDDLEAVTERVGQMRAAADDLRCYQEALGLPQDSFEEVEDAGREAQARLQLWGLVLKAHQCEEERARQLELAERKAAVSSESGPGQASADNASISSSLSLNSIDLTLATIAAEASKMEAQLEEVQEADRGGPVWCRAKELLEACKGPHNFNK